MCFGVLFYQEKNAEITLITSSSIMSVSGELHLSISCLKVVYLISTSRHKGTLMNEYMPCYSQKVYCIKRSKDRQNMEVIAIKSHGRTQRATRDTFCRLLMTEVHVWTFQ